MNFDHYGPYSLNKYILFPVDLTVHSYADLQKFSTILHGKNSQGNKHGSSSRGSTHGNNSRATPFEKAVTVS